MRQVPPPQELALKWSLSRVKCPQVNADDLDHGQKRRVDNCPLYSPKSIVTLLYILTSPLSLTLLLAKRCFSIGNQNAIPHYPPVTTYRLPSGVLLLPRTKTKYWAYTTSSLANTTSTECKEAYSAEIACDDYIVAVVNANEDRHFLPSKEFSDMADMCTKTCRDSLTKYIQNVEEKCSESGDAALNGRGIYGEMELEDIPVETVGRILEYHLMRGCAEDETGENCYINESSSIPTEFKCSWTCAVAYRYNQHEYPYSEWQFGSTSGRGVRYEVDKDGNLESPINISGDVLVQHAVFEEGMEEGWEIASNCRRNASVQFQTGIKGVDAGSETADVKANGSNSTSEEKANAGEVPSNGTASSDSADPESAAVRVGVAGGWASVMILVSSLVYMIRCENVGG
ncbi:uncharacterized protein BDV17DRAFT_29263 [Aspergillus undulatus]|uniref:uncharacterized protein n=1 Tax=Aspergillus undulatus TaxID=1810928 RepID=UPI003CCD35E9